MDLISIWFYQYFLIQDAIYFIAGLPWPSCIHCTSCHGACSQRWRRWFSEWAADLSSLGALAQQFEPCSVSNLVVIYSCSKIQHQHHFTLPVVRLPWVLFLGNSLKMMGPRDTPKDKNKLELTPCQFCMCVLQVWGWAQRQHLCLRLPWFPHTSKIQNFGTWIEP